MTLDDIYEIMSWPIGELDPVRLSVRMQVTRVVFMICVKALLNGTLGREAARERRGPRRDRPQAPREKRHRGRRIASFGENGPRAEGREKLRRVFG
jgi:hypothetical protein